MIFIGTRRVRQPFCRDSVTFLLKTRIASCLDRAPNERQRGKINGSEQQNTKCLIRRVGLSADIIVTIIIHYDHDFRLLSTSLIDGLNLKILISVPFKGATYQYSSFAEPFGAVLSNW